MESATILALHNTDLGGFYFPPEPNSLEGQEYLKHISTISMHGEKFYLLHTETMTAVVSFRNRENL